MWPLSTNLSIKISCFNYSIKQLSSIKIIKTITLTDKRIINELTPQVKWSNSNQIYGQEKRERTIFRLYTLEYMGDRTIKNKQTVN